MADPDRRFSPTMYWVGHIATLASIFAVFASLIVAYLWRSSTPAFWRPIALPRQLWLSSGLLVSCSVAIEMARWALRERGVPQYSLWLMRTGWLATGFLVSQVLCWRSMTQAGGSDDNQNRGLFYILTGAHAVHIVGGIAVLAYLIWRVWKPLRFDTAIRRDAITFMLATYWHFMAIIWFVLYAMFATHSA
jgi:cytochrome c oxidase subunit III